MNEIKYKQLLNENEKLREDKKNYEKLKVLNSINRDQNFTVGRKTFFREYCKL